MGKNTLYSEKNIFHLEYISQNTQTQYVFLITRDVPKLAMGHLPYKLLI